MPVKIKVAQNAREIDDALRLRHEVFVIEDGKFGGIPLPGERLIDRFDAFPSSYHVIAYEGLEPVATMRLIRDSEVGLPVDELYDFEDYRSSIQAQPGAACDDSQPVPGPIFGSAGMLAVRSQWRRRRDVIRSMFRMAATVCHRNGATHILVVVNHDTAGMYRRFGFSQLSEKIWNADIGNYIVPLVGATDQFVAWALHDLVNTPLSAFQDSFERLVLRAGEIVFTEGDVGEHAYVVDSGEIRISRTRESGEELTLAHLSPGDLFGELALIDAQPRSATATAMSDSELITLDRRAFQAQLKLHPEWANNLLRIFSGRVRAMDELAMVLAFSQPSQRLEFAIDIARRRSSRDRTNPAQTVFRGGPRELALLAAVDEASAVEFLERAVRDGALSYSHKHIAFSI